MFNKFCLAAAVAIGGMMFGGDTKANADNCRYGYSYRPSVGVYSAPIRVAPRPVYGVYRSGYGYPVSPYRGYRAPIGGFGPGFGYGYGPGFYGRGTSIGFGRGGVSIGFGF